MQSRALLLRLCLSAFALASAHAADTNTFWQTPAVPGFGRMHPLPDAAYQPDKNATYKIVFEISAAGKGSSDVSPALERLARTVNLYRASGVPASQLKFVAVADGPATTAVLSDDAYQHQFGVKNPNLPIIAALRKAGVEVAVCGQAVAEHEYEYSWVDPSVTVTLSALTTVTILQQQGYAYMRF